jgi:hypothetical protein
MAGFFGFPFAGKDECNKCNACACGASACGCNDNCGCGCKKEKKPWFNWWNKGCDNGCGCDDKCGGKKFGNFFDWFN